MELLLLSVLYCTSLKFTTAVEELKRQNTSSKIDHVELMFNNAFPHDYDAQEVPSHALVHIAVALVSIPSVKFSRMEIEAEFVFAAAWQDDRLNFSEAEEEKGRKHRRITVPDSIMKRLWIPWVMFSECKRCKSGKATTERPGMFVFTPAKRLFMMAFRDSILFTCHYDLTYYPFDKHECKIDLELIDVTDTNSSMKLKDSYALLFRHPMEDAPNPGLPSEFYFDSLFVKHACAPTFFGKPRNPDQCLQYGVRFHRIAAYYLMLIYTPSCTIVLVSWISFWLQVDSPAPRVTLGLTSLLTLTTQFSAAQKDLPPVAYIKSLDIWMIMCVIMVFGSLLEFVLAHTLMHQHKPALKVQEPKTTPAALILKEGGTHPAFEKTKYPAFVKKSKQVNWLDTKARLAFPIIFVVFNIIYWPCCARTG